MSVAKVRVKYHEHRVRLETELEAPQKMPRSLFIVQYSALSNSQRMYRSKCNVNSCTAGVFFFFAGCTVIMTISVWFLFPETSMLPVEHTHQIFRQHPFWKKYQANS
ncbi:MAG: hypothetical protein EOO68_26160 [Moraxellaceae bacterium]|nr:MAG: hypothetical protein EOO68_26160 [Moraxellaceae bacterium]